MKVNKLVLYLIIILSTSALCTGNSDSLQITFSPYLNIKYKVGFELNPGLLLYASDKEATVISAGISVFPKNRKTELYIPIIYEYARSDDWFNGNYFGKSINLEFHYRHYLIGKLGGIYNSVGLKYNYAYLEPEEDPEVEYEYFKKEIVSRLGLGFGVGYRIFSDDRFYWGIGIFMGRYLVGRDISDKISVSSMFTRDENLFVTIQLLKFGFVF